MLPLQTQEQFEELNGPTLKTPTLVYFTANWCGACKRINWDFLQEEFGANLTIYKCDIDENKYTPGFCGVRSIPNFMMLTPTGQQKPTLTGPFQSSDTAKVAAWIQSNLIKNKN